MVAYKTPKGGHDGLLVLRSKDLSYLASFSSSEKQPVLLPHKMPLRSNVINCKEKTVYDCARSDKN